MTGQTGTSNFNARADAAANALLAELQQKGRPAQGRKVQVDENGQPAKPLPPEGSYLRMEIERQRAENAAAAQQQLAQQQREVPPPAPEGVDGTEQLPENGAAAAEAGEGSLSDNARRRFAQLSRQLHDRERDLEQEREAGRRRDGELADLRATLEALQRERDELTQQSLENFDPAARMQAVNEARTRTLLAEQERRLVAQFKPQLDGLRERSIDHDLERLAQKYPRFDLDLHGPLIQEYRQGNPQSSLEQAFKAIAEPDEIMIRPVQAHLPPVVEPGSGPNAVRNVPVPERDPDERLRADARRGAEMRRSSDPNERLQGLKVIERNLAERVAGRFARRS